LIGYLYGITSERKLVENCACIWRGDGSRTGFDQRFHHSTFPRTGTAVSGIEAVDELFDRSCAS